MPTTDDWNAQLMLADFDRLTADVGRWVESAPQWPPLDRARALWKRISPRLEEMRLDFDRVLVVGVVGGTGTGKSTLLNALVGQAFCPTGDAVRPTTRQGVVLAHPDLDTAFLQLDGCQAEVRQIDSPLLRHIVLIDCPDPDTQSPLSAGEDESGGNSDAGSSPDENRNLEILRCILPRCDVLLCTGTAQKYKTHAVAAELLRHAPGRAVVFVQTHATVDADITADWQRHLESQGFNVPQMFRLDGRDALDRLQERLPAPAEFAKLLDFLHAELAGRPGNRIRRSNAIELLAWFLDQVQTEIDAALPAAEKIDEAVAAERSRLFEQIRGRLTEQLRGNQGVWRARLLRQVTMNWGWGPFASFLRLFSSARSMLKFLPAMRARGLGPMLVTGGIGVGKAVADKVRQSLAESNWLAAAELGIGPGDLAQSQSVIAGFAQQAGIDDTRQAGDRSGAESLTAAAQRLYQQIESEVAAAIQRRATRRAGGVFHAVLELLFAALPAVLLWRLGKDFFYDHLWRGSTEPLLGIDFLVQAALWVLVWGLLLRGLLLWRLQSGLRRELARIVDRLTPADALGSLFEEFTAAAASIRQYATRPPALRAQLDRLRHRLESTGQSQLGRLR